jgi:hypothetical protein
LDKFLCPFKLCASIFQRILSYKWTKNNIPVPLARKGNNIISITSDKISTIIEDGVETIGKTKCNILQSEVGTYSIRISAAMAIYLE